MSRHRSLQNGRQVLAGVHSTGLPQVGQLTMVGELPLLIRRRTAVFGELMDRQRVA